MLSHTQGGADGSLPVWGAWVEISKVTAEMVGTMSLPVWGAWVEMSGTA